MKTFAASLFAAVTSAELMTSMDYAFMRYVSSHSKMYQTVEEFNLRKAAYALVDEHVQRVNSDPTSTYKAGHNRFSDWTPSEWDAILGLKDMPKPDFEPVVEEDEEVALNLPTAWDWRSKGMVTPVKDQGSCGSCWAFSSIEAIESAWLIAGNEQIIMSEQELVDCSSETGNEGCNGGWYFWSYDWLKTNFTMKESDYPYTAVDGNCNYDASKGVTEVSSYGRTIGTNKNLAQLYQQPVNVAVAAGNAVFGSYQSGIVTADAGCPTQIDHAIVAVGWGEENGVQYYIVRNSWGEGWGEDGYIRIATSGGLGVCGINQYVYYPTL